VSDSDDPKKQDPPPTEPDPGATVAWDPEEVFGAGEAPAADAPPGPDPGATMAWDPEEVAQLVEQEAAAASEEEKEDDPLIGTLLRDKWKVLKRLGAGSFGTVYKVEDVKGGWVDALKILGVDRLVGAEADNMRKRFLREAQIMKRLGKESKHIVGLSTYEEDFEAGLIYFLMEYVEGRPLSDAVAEDGPFSVERTIHVALQVCDALIAAHEGAELVVHRDLKLENLMMTVDHNGEELVKVLDFGIAKIAEKETDTRLTTVGTLGTPGYAAPEQLRAEEVDGRTDLFAFGVILYSLLTGRDPWLGGLAHVPTAQIYELMVATDRGEVRPMEDAGVDVPPAMKNVVMKLLRRDPADRYQSASELQEALRRVLAGGADADAGSVRVLTDEPGVHVQIRSGRQVVAEGATPCVANGVAPGSYKIILRDERYESVETSITLGPGAIEDVTLVATPRSTGVGATVKRRSGLVAAIVVLLVAASGALVVRPWGRTLELAELEARAAAGSVTSAWLTESGLAGQLAIGPLPGPFIVTLDDDAKADALAGLRASGLEVNTAWEVRRLLESAAAAQAEGRYFGADGDDVLSIAARLDALDPGSPEARSLRLKVAERMAWDAADAATDEAAALVSDCLALVPDHPSCLALRSSE
jgi:eukaryotic-like serine/threonine-protein kinase